MIGRRHHYVPQFIIRRFANDGGRVFVLDRDRPEVGPRADKVEAVLAENHLYSKMKGGSADDRSLEADLSELEGLAAPIAGKLIDQARLGQPPKLTGDERRIWDEFFSVQWRRVPEMHKKAMTDEAFAAQVDEAAEEFEQFIRPMTEEERAFIEGAKSDNHFRHNVAVGAVRRPSALVRGALRRRGLLLATPARSSKSFVLGSRPIVRAGPAGATLAHPELEAWITLAPDVAFSYYGAAGATNLNRLTDRDVRRLNQMITNQSRFVVARDPRLLESLVGPR